MDSGSELCRRLRLLAVQLGAHLTVMNQVDENGTELPVRPVEDLRGCGGEWNPSTGSLWVIDVVGLAGRAMLLAHELGHVVLHPTGEAEPAPLPDEETTVHHSASTVCDRFGVPGYLECLANAEGCPAPSDPISDEAAVLAAKLVELLDEL